MAVTGDADTTKTKTNIKSNKTITARRLIPTVTYRRSIWFRMFSGRNILTRTMNHMMGEELSDTVKGREMDIMDVAAGGTKLQEIYK